MEARPKAVSPAGSSGDVRMNLPSDVTFGQTPPVRTRGLFSKENPCPFATLPGTLEQAEVLRSLGARSKARSSTSVRSRSPASVRAREEVISETRARESMASEDHNVTEGSVAVQRLFQKRNAEKTGAILERIARHMSTSEVSGMPTSASTPIPTSQDFGYSEHRDPLNSPLDLSEHRTL